MRRVAVVACLGSLLSLVACGGSAGTTATTGASGPATPGSRLQPVLVATQLAVGTDRFPIGVSDRNTPVSDATVHVRTFGPSGGSMVLKDEADAPYRGDGLEGRGLYVAQLHFDVAGAWSAQVTASRPGMAPTTVALQFGVRPVTEVPMVGQTAPRSHSLTTADVPDVSYIDSGKPPDDMHALSIADAIAQHRPALVVFATPAFCQSATCGPQVNAVQQLEPAYRDRLAFIHVEVYRNFKPNPAQRQLSPTMAEWHLQTEPWVFLIDRQGNVGAVFEGATASDELKPAIDRLLS